MDVKNQIESLLKIYDGLSYDSEKHQLQGIIYLSPEDSYEVEIRLNSYPHSFPEVYEIGERIPSKLDRHKFYNSDQCCFTTNAKAQILLKTEVKSLLDFMKKIVTPYFENNSYYEINKKYRFGEFGHGFVGNAQGYQEILDIKDDSQIKLVYPIIRRRLNGFKMRPNDKCYCGSNLKLKKCHRRGHLKRYKKFKLIDKSVLQKDLKEFEEASRQLR